MSLNEAERRRERDAQEARQKLCDLRTDSTDKSRKVSTVQKASSRVRKAFRDDGLQADERNLATELAEEKARKNTKDVLLDEAVHIISDQVGLIRSGTKGVAEAKPRLSVIAE